MYPFRSLPCPQRHLYSPCAPLEDVTILLGLFRNAHTNSYSCHHLYSNELPSTYFLLTAKIRCVGPLRFGVTHVVSYGLV
jgi:hypothetical protein